MFQPLKHKNEIAGFEKRVNNAIFFFGTKHAPKELLPQLYPDLKFAFLKQVHGNEVVWGNEQQIQTADAQATNMKNLALVIQTADCVPLLFAGRDHVAAAHAGWRGIAARIVNTTAKFLNGKHVHEAAIGPHIGRTSFEVGNDVAEQLNQVAHGDGAINQHPDPSKKYVDLHLIARRQLHQEFNPGLTIESVDGDTFTSPLYHSYRRGKNRGERQFSFVALV